MSFIFDGINAFDSPLFIKKSTTDNVINVLTGSTITVTTGTATPVANFSDFNASTLVTCTPDSVFNPHVQLKIDFGVGTTRYFDTLILSNLTCSGSGMSSISIGYSTDGVHVTYFKTSAISGNYDFICIKGTNASAYRYAHIDFTTVLGDVFTIGELFLCYSANLVYVTMPAGVMSIVNNYFEKVAYNELIDGGFIGAITSNKYGATYGYEWLPKADRDNMETLKNTKTDFAVIPSPQTTNEIYHVYWINQWNFSFTDKYQSAGWTGTVEVREL